MRTVLSEKNLVLINKNSRNCPSFSYLSDEVRQCFSSGISSRFFIKFVKSLDFFSLMCVFVLEGSSSIVRYLEIWLVEKFRKNWFWRNWAAIVGTRRGSRAPPKHAPIHAPPLHARPSSTLEEPNFLKHNYCLIPLIFREYIVNDRVSS